ncbi:MAG: hypothetical protein KF782_25425 [Labilithrix sp.]|nr:hypothetical protein [Labilithrix sp.]
MKLRFSFALATIACSLAACAVPEDDADSTSDEVVAGEACLLAQPSDALCAAVYDPVCGCDGKTYGNACEAARVVKSSTPGACPPADGGSCKLPQPNEDVACIALYDPVCGCDGKTYGNACEAARFVTSSTPGECASKKE